MGLTNTEMKQGNTKEPKPTPIDFIQNGVKKRVSGVARTRLVNHGKWALDKERGKHLCLIEIEIEEMGVVLNFTPADSFEDELLRSWLEAEKRNDNFPFRNPTRGATRPKQLLAKVTHLRGVLQEYDNGNPKQGACVGVAVEFTVLLAHQGASRDALTHIFPAARHFLYII